MNFRRKQLARWVCCLSSWAWLVSVGAAQETFTVADRIVPQCRLDSAHPAPLALGRIVSGIDRECLLCHSSGNQGGYTGPLSLEEAKIWKNSDAHSVAYAALLNEASREIGRRMGRPDVIHRDARCLACHGGFPLHAVELEDGLIPEKILADHQHLLAWGVSCESCHGAAKTGKVDSLVLEGWLEPHRAEGWKERHTLQEMQSKFGFYDVRSPVSRGKMCVSCHVGSAAEGRVVTHEMYAAGHPPLPDFELEAFQRQMPPHWRTKQNSETAPEDPGVEHERALRNMAVGAAVTWAQQLRLTAQLAKREVALPAHQTGWPELAQFECYACHHELRKSGWRLDRELAVTPGRPLLHGAPAPLFQAMLVATGGNIEELKEHQQWILAEISQRPFGTPAKELSPVLLEAADWADQAAGRLEGADFLASQEQILLQLSKFAAADVYEYDTARQLYWAFQEASQAAGPENLPRDVALLLPEAQAMFLANLSDARTISGRDAIANANREVRLINLAVVFPPIANYDGLAFREIFAKIHKSLSEEARQE